MCDTIALAGDRGTGAAATRNLGGPIRVICLVVILTGCATPEFVDPAASADHPANPLADESPTPEPTATLSIPAIGEGTKPRPGGMHHGGQPMDAGQETGGHHHGHGTAK